MRKKKMMQFLSTLGWVLVLFGSYLGTSLSAGTGDGILKYRCTTQKFGASPIELTHFEVSLNPKNSLLKITQLDNNFFGFVSAEGFASKSIFSMDEGANNNMRVEYSLSSGSIFYRFLILPALSHKARFFSSRNDGTGGAYPYGDHYNCEPKANRG